MTGRVQALIVVLDRDYPEDDLPEFISAIRHLRAVVGVEMVGVDPATAVARQRVVGALRKRLEDVLDDALFDDDGGCDG